ncbi:MAG: Ig-like domain-containing protein, partial [Myxococcaceae bacterium]
RLGAAAATLPPPFNDVGTLRLSRGLIALPPGFVALDPSRTQTTFTLRAVVTDIQGDSSSADATLVVTHDTLPPVAEVLRPALSAQVVEHTPVLIQVSAHDNVFVERVQVLAGSDPGNLGVVFEQGGFPPVNAALGSAFDVYAPVVSYELTAPTLQQLGASQTAPYFIAARAIDINGNTGSLFIQTVHVMADVPPTVSIVSPSDGSPAVSQSNVTVVVAAQDDVAIATVQLFVDGAPIAPILHSPPFAFQVPVPSSGTALTLLASAVDSFGHPVVSQLVRLPIVADQPPTVAIASPRPNQTLTEGRSTQFLVAAQDDVAIVSVEATVEGGMGGTLNFASTQPPYAFVLPLPYGSAGRTLTLRARARDSAGHVSIAPDVLVPVVADTVAPTVQLTSPSDNSQMVEGLRVAVEARADDNVGVASVAFSLGGVLLATMPAPPYRFSYLVPRGSSGQLLAFSAKATDTSGNTTTATATVEVIPDQAPAVTLIPPVQLVAGLPFTLQATASDDTGLSFVSFHVGPQTSQPTEAGRRYVLPYALVFIPDKSLEGQSVTVQARAVDLAGHETWSATTSVPVVADQPPRISITRPLTGAVVFDGATVRIEASASDPDDRVASVVFLVDGNRVSQASSPAGIPGAPSLWAGSFVAPAGSGNRTFILTAVAIDGSGQQTVSDPVVIGTVQDTVAPLVQMVDPADLDVVTEGDAFTVSAVAVDNVGIANVQFFAQGQSVGATAVAASSSAGRPLYKLPWLPPTGKVGQRVTLSASGADPSSNVGASEPVQVELGLRPSSTLVPFMARLGTELSSLTVRDDGMALVTASTIGDFPEGHGARLLLLKSTGPTALGAFSLPGPPTASTLAGTLALVATDTQTLHTGQIVPPALSVFDVSNTSLPQLRGNIELPASPTRGVAVRDRLVFVADGSAGVVVVDLGDPASPQRLMTVPIVGEARDLVLAGNLLLVAAGPAGLRIFDIRDPRLRELGFIALPVGANTVRAQGSRAFVGCDGAGAQLAVVDFANPAKPLLLSLLPHSPARRDLIATGLVGVDISGNLALATAQLVDQNAIAVKGLLSASVVRADGTARTLVRANLPRANRVSHGLGGAVALFGDRSVATFSLPSLLVTDVLPGDGSQAVPLAAPELSIAVELSAPPEPGTLASAVTLRAQDAAIGPVVPATVSVTGRRISIVPSAPLSTATQYFVTLEDSIATANGVTLDERYTFGFKTRSSANLPPALTDVQPPAGPMEGGTLAKLTGAHFAPGARVFFSGAEASQVTQAPDAGFLTALTPPQVEGPSTVTVVNTDGLEASLVGGFVYLPILQVNFVVPATGRLAGGTTVEISGSGFERGATVSFGGNAAGAVEILSPGRLRAVTPAGPFGPSDVLVTNPDGKRALAVAAFVYTEVSVSGVVARYVPSWDGPVRPSHTLAQGTPGHVALSGKVAWVLSKAQVATEALDPVQLLSSSVFGTVGLVDVTNPTAPFVLGGLSFQPPYEPRDLAVRGTLGYVVADGPDLPHVNVQGEGGPSLLVVDASDPHQPRLLSAVQFEGTAKQVALADDLALVAAGPAGLVLFSLANPLQPVLLGSVKQFALNGAVTQQPVNRVVVSGHYALLSLGAELQASWIVVDLALPGLPAIGQLAGGGVDASLVAARGLIASENRVETLSIAPPSSLRIAGTAPSFLQGSRYGRTALGPHLGAVATYTSGGAMVELLSSNDLAHPQVVDVVGLFPASELADVAIDRDIIVASVAKTYAPAFRPVPNDALEVIQLPFPMVVATNPAEGAAGVPPGTSVQIELSRAVGDASATTVYLTREDGSAAGMPVPATVTVSGATVTLAPSQALSTSATYRITVSGAHDAVTGSPMPAPFSATFATATSATAVPVTLASLTPRQGPVAGGTPVTLVGTGFAAGMEVRFSGGLAVVQQVSPDGTSAVVVTPPNAVGASALTLLTPANTGLTRLGAFLYVQPLSLVSVTPDRGPSSGGTRVVLRGTGFAPGGNVQVTFGGLPALQVRVMGLDVLECFTPFGLHGVVDVVATNPDGVSATLAGAFTFDQPTGSSVAMSGRIRDVVVIGDLAFLAVGGSVQVVDLSGLYRFGPFAGLPIPPDRRAQPVREGGSLYADDRIVGSIGLGGEVTSLSYPPGGGHLLYAGTRSFDGRRDSPTLGKAIAGAVYQLDVSDPANPRVLGGHQVTGAGVSGVDARNDRLLAAAGALGLLTFDITHPPFLLGTSPTPPGAKVLAVREGIAVLGTGTVDLTPRHAVVGGRLQLLSVEGKPAVLGGVPLSTQRIRLRGPLAVVAAGDDGLVLVDTSNPAAPVQLASVDVGGFAWDVALSGDLAYVAAGAAGIAVVDISELLNPRVLYHVTGAVGGDALGVGVGGSMLLSSRDRG